MGCREGVMRRVVRMKKGSSTNTSTAGARLTHLTSVTFLHHRLVFSSPPPPHDMSLQRKAQPAAPLGGRRRVVFSLSLSIKRQMTAEQEYLSGNSHLSFIIDQKEDLIGGSNSWMGWGGGGVPHRLL